MKIKKKISKEPRNPGKDFLFLGIAGLGIFLLAMTPQETKPIVIGSKSFAESNLLGEMLAQLLEDRGIPVERKLWLGGTKVCSEALMHGDIHVYPEYSGTIVYTLLKVDHRPAYPELQKRVRKDLNLELLDSFGFHNGYALMVRQETAEKRNLKSISDLKNHSDLRIAVTHEFLNREDGWPSLASAYDLSVRPTGLEHGLAYQAIAEGETDVIDAYTTDGKLLKYTLFGLKDDLNAFPKYFAAPLIHPDLDPKTKEVLNLLAGVISEETMIALNAQVEIEEKSFASVAQTFLREQGLLSRPAKKISESLWGPLFRRTGEHLLLTFGAVLAAILLAVPLGVLIYRLSALSKPVLYIAGILQTIPSIALLALLLPLFGLGWKPAVVALFLYALLPILRNTTTGLFSIDPVLKKVGRGMGLTPMQQLRTIELPLALPTILAGIRTASVITIGTATLAAFIGAGGLGESIVTGLQLNRTDLILQGAIPAILLAVLVELAFEGIEKLLVPKHLLQ